MVRNETTNNFYFFQHSVSKQSIKLVNFNNNQIILVHKMSKIRLDHSFKKLKSRY